MNVILYPPKTPIAFNLFNLEIRWYGIIIAFAIFLGIFLNYIFIKKQYGKDDANIFLDFCPSLILISIFGARLFYVIAEFDFYIHNPIEIIMINHGGLSIFGGIISAIVYFYSFCKKNKVSFYKYADSICLFLPVSQSIGRMGNYFNQEAFGRPCNGIIKLFVDSAFRPEKYINENYFHPTFLYEGILDIINFILLITIFFLFKNKIKKGTIFYLYLIFYSIIRIFVESIRIDSVCSIFNLPIAIVISTCILLFSIYMLFSRHGFNH